MTTDRVIRIAVLALTCAALPMVASSRVWPSEQQSQPDNTANNKGDNSKGAVTADRQKEAPADREMAKKIRKSIASDSALSTYAHNIKIVVIDGMVTLKGPVKTDSEKTAIGAKATDIAGADKVQNELTVKQS
jgi:hyperosmotically inducible periplasmic protein